MTTQTMNRDRMSVRFEDANMSSSTCVGGDDEYELEKQFSPIKKGGSSSSSSSKPSGSENIKLDSKGLPLVPQPSRFKDDPLVSFDEVPTDLEIDINLTAELACLVEVGSPAPSRLHGLPGPVQRSAHQPIACAAQQGFPCRFQNSSLLDHDGNHFGWCFAVHLDTPDQYLWQAANHLACHPTNHLGRHRVRTIPRFQLITRNSSTLRVRVRGHDVGRHGMCQRHVLSP